ncbi:MAG: hypothetical protein ACOYL1_05245 [Chlamydiia bacterium]
MQPPVGGEPLVSTIVSFDWLEDLCDRYKEMHWLADEEVEMTQESVAIASEYSHSYCIYQKYFPEFDRTALALKAFSIFYEGDYRDYLLFSYKQESAFRLSYKTFRKIQEFFQTTLDSLEGIDVPTRVRMMESFILFSDLGKTKTARLLAEESGIYEGNHDCFFAKVAKKNPDIFPSFSRLPEKAKKVLLALANQPHFGSMAHFEGGIELFQKLEESNFLDDPTIFDLSFMAHMCDVAGAQGHVEPTSSINYTEKTHQLLMDLREACVQIPQRGASRGWDLFLQKRAKALDIKTEGYLNQVVLRISSMMRFTTPYEVQCLKKSLFQLPQETIEKIADVFSWENKIEARYMPAVMLNLVNNPMLGNNLNERISQATQIGLPFLVDSILNSGKRSYLNFNRIAKIAKEDPKTLLVKTFNIDEKGFVQTRILSKQGSKEIAKACH